MEEFFVVGFIVPAFVVGVLALLFGLGRFVGAERLATAGRRLRHSQFTIGQMMAAVAVAALILLFLGSAPGPGRIFPLTLLALWVLAWFLRHWREEFVALMGLRDEDLPGRHDKLIWVAMVLFLAPVGVWFFRAYRLAHWPEPAPAPEAEHPAGEVGGAATLPA